MGFASLVISDTDCAMEFHLWLTDRFGDCVVQGHWVFEGEHGDTLRQRGHFARGAVMLFKFIGGPHVHPTPTVVIKHPSRADRFALDELRKHLAMATGWSHTG